VRLPNVDTLVEMMDMRDATRAYEANLNMIDAARQMTSRTLDLLRR
jgi:flagellar basal-body rod protein FlgC